MKLTKYVYILPLTAALSLTGLLLSGFSVSCAGPETEPSPTYSCIEVPKSISFCGIDIDLTRYDRRERMDRELMAFTYMHSTSLQIIKRANRYFPIVESILKEQGVPDDFKYLMVIESNVNPLARSGAGAAGLWQFMSGTARDFDLEVNHHVDERYDVEKSTVAACKYLKQAYRKFGNWETVAASYNAGQGRISQQQDRQYVDNALDLYLVEETSRYVYRILAAKMLLTNPKQFGFYLRSSDLYPPIPYRTIKVTEDIDDLPRFAKGQGINFSLLKSMNPWLRGTSLPNHNGKEYLIRIPDQTEMHYNPRVTLPHNPAWVVE
ncbi:lytic transglycosylase domain-containing protein [Bacteroides mediterraneensis]|uniref:lytic transglycosylase domain-containing protein n=1 Tax=Bacteroides mediterraneensis TaxID=1841856 RepID=UPI0026ED1CE7|nr:lytic transglycosylase domain-containing protein [Bacteroides mediterraneensis]